MLRSQREDPLLVELLLMLADRQSDTGPLKAGKAMAIGRAWLEGSPAATRRRMSVDHSPGVVLVPR